MRDKEAELTNLSLNTGSWRSMFAVSHSSHQLSTLIYQLCLPSHETQTRAIAQISPRSANLVRRLLHRFKNALKH